MTHILGTRCGSVSLEQAWAAGWGCLAGGSLGIETDLGWLMRGFSHLSDVVELRDPKGCPHWPWPLRLPSSLPLASPPSLPPTYLLPPLSSPGSGWCPSGWGGTGEGVCRLLVGDLLGTCTPSTLPVYPVDCWI